MSGPADFDHGKMKHISIPLFWHGWRFGVLWQRGGGGDDWWFYVGFFKIER